MEISFLAELKKDEFLKTDKESVGHVLLERLRLMHLRCISPKSEGDEIILEGADVDDPNMPYSSNNGEFLASASSVYRVINTLLR